MASSLLPTGAKPPRGALYRLEEAALTLALGAMRALRESGREPGVDTLVERIADLRQNRPHSRRGTASNGVARRHRIEHEVSATLDVDGGVGVRLHDPDDPGGSRDDFAESGISGPDDIEETFTKRFYFGCEADDPMNALAFSKSMHQVRR